MSFHSGILGPHEEHDRVDSCGPWPLEEHKLDLSSIDGSADILGAKDMNVTMEQTTLSRSREPLSPLYLPTAVQTCNAIVNKMQVQRIIDTLRASTTDGLFGDEAIEICYHAACAAEHVLIREGVLPPMVMSSLSKLDLIPSSTHTNLLKFWEQNEPSIEPAHVIQTSLKTVPKKRKRTECDIAVEGSVSKKATKKPVELLRFALRKMLADRHDLHATLRRKGKPVNKMCVGDLKPLLQATLTTPDGCELVTLDDCKQATIVEDALMKLFPSDEWDYSALADQAICKHGGSQYKLEGWLATSGKWPPCGQPTLDQLIEDV